MILCSVFGDISFLGLTDRILLSLFKRGCQNLKSLDLSYSARLLTDYSLYLIGKQYRYLVLIFIKSGLHNKVSVITVGISHR
jgi:hypothetical protein